MVLKSKKIFNVILKFDRFSAVQGSLKTFTALKTKLIQNVQRITIEIPMYSLKSVVKLRDQRQINVTLPKKSDI